MWVRGREGAGRGMVKVVWGEGVGLVRGGGGGGVWVEWRIGGWVRRCGKRNSGWGGEGGGQEGGGGVGVKGVGEGGGGGCRREVASVRVRLGGGRGETGREGGSGAKEKGREGARVGEGSGCQGRVRVKGGGRGR